ncbi:hypothetical protein ACFYMW_18125 [Streptomyces sp. NPDC006692]|uniref:pPIWI_RE_Y domain-containing protein n=1 Tax=Streptomyces sp. NPDC006692 TaxID=3364758 RepID=UPI00368973CB
MTATSAASLDFFRGETLLRMTATALVHLSRRRSPGTPVYDDAVQKAYNHMVLHCLTQGAEPPTSVPDLVRWAADVPTRSWPLDLPEELEAADDYLVDSESCTPTQQCFEWAVSAADAAAEQFENQLIGEALALSRAAGSPESYTAFRRLLITRPVLTGTALALLGADVDLVPLIDTIKRCYEPAPAAYLRNGRFAECSRCHCLLVPVRDDRYHCELDRCRRERHPQVTRHLEATANGGVYQLSRPLRMFITGPGLAETNLEEELISLGLRPEMWPNFDAYDLRITLPDGRVWAIDVKDRANPALLGRTARPFRPQPPYDWAFLVVPQYRFDEREAYGRIFAHHCDEETAGRLVLLSDTDFLRQVRTALRRHRAEEEGNHHA